MNLNVIHSYLVNPEKHAEKQTQIKGSAITDSGRLLEMLKGVFLKSDSECRFDIAFNPNTSGEQQNDCRDLLIDYLFGPSLAKGRLIAERLQRSTNKISGMGLLFLLCGQGEEGKKLVISRFPAETGILADENETTLSIQYLEKVFMKGANTYKAAVYRGRSRTNDYWDGKAIDKQINSNFNVLSNYWIRDFLDSDFRTTGAQGTRRLAMAIIGATKTSADLVVKEELSAASRLSSGLKGKITSASDFCSRFHLSPAARNAIKSQLPNEAVFTERFRFSVDEYSKHVVFQSVELSNGALLTADAESFEEVFEKEVLDKDGQEVRFSTRGKIINQRLQKTRK